MKPGRRLTVGVYETTSRFRGIEIHHCVCREDDGEVVAICGPPGDPDTEEDARLFSAAPELLAACRGMLNPTGHTDACMEMRAYGVGHCAKACERLRAAIARATGEPADPPSSQLAERSQEVLEHLAEANRILGHEEVRCYFAGSGLQVMLLLDCQQLRNQITALLKAAGRPRSVGRASNDHDLDTWG